MVVYPAIGLVWALIHHFFITPKRLLTEEATEVILQFEDEFGQEKVTKSTNTATVSPPVCNTFIWPLTTIIYTTNTTFEPLIQPSNNPYTF